MVEHAVTSVGGLVDWPQLWRLELVDGVELADADRLVEVHLELLLGFLLLVAELLVGNRGPRRVVDTGAVALGIDEGGQTLLWVGLARLETAA